MCKHLCVNTTSAVQTPTFLTIIPLISQYCLRRRCRRCRCRRSVHAAAPACRGHRGDPRHSPTRGPWASPASPAPGEEAACFCWAIFGRINLIQAFRNRVSLCKHCVNTSPSCANTCCVNTPNQCANTFLNPLFGVPTLAQGPWIRRLA